MLQYNNKDVYLCTVTFKTYLFSLERMNHLYLHTITEFCQNKMTMLDITIP